MKIVRPLTKDERKWIDDLQSILNKCPSNRLGFYTTGDNDVTVIDKEITDQYEESNKIPDTYDYCAVVYYANSKLGSLFFPNNVQSTAG